MFLHKFKLYDYMKRESKNHFKPVLLLLTAYFYCVIVSMSV